MGLFDKFRKKENENINKKTEALSPYEITFSNTEDGRLQVDFYERNADFKQFYDTTRLIIGGKKKNIENIVLDEALVSWYGSSDAIMFDKNGKEFGRLTAYQEILTKIDTNLLHTDMNYCITVMKSLLNRKRIENLMEQGLSETPERPCGNYIGEITKNETNYSKAFNMYTGQMVHNSSFMKEKREEHRQKIQEHKRQQIMEKQAQIERLNNEIDDLSK